MAQAGLAVAVYWTPFTIPAAPYPVQEAGCCKPFAVNPNFPRTSADLRTGIPPPPPPPPFDLQLTRRSTRTCPFLQAIHRATGSRMAMIETQIAGLPLPLHPGAAPDYLRSGIGRSARLMGQLRGATTPCQSARPGGLAFLLARVPCPKLKTDEDAGRAAQLLTVGETLANFRPVLLLDRRLGHNHMSAFDPASLVGTATATRSTLQALPRYCRRCFLLRCGARARAKLCHL